MNMRRYALLLLFIAVTLFTFDLAAYARKSPVRHRVSSYTRKDGTHVSSYMRGKGSRSPRFKSGGSAPYFGDAPQYVEQEDDYVDMPVEEKVFKKFGRWPLY